MSNQHVVLDGVNKIFNSDKEPLHVLKDINLEIRRGEFVAIVGASGCGKSTLLRLLMNLETIDNGKLEWNPGTAANDAGKLGIVFQDHRLFPWLTVLDNVILGLENEPLSKDEKRERALETLKLVGLDKFSDAHPARLSGGMAQRAAIARALAGRPDILLLDEPFGALDAFTKLQLQKELARIWDRDKLTTVLVTHDIEEAIFLADRVIVLEPRPGRIKQEFTVDFARPRLRSDNAFQRLKEGILNIILTEGQDGFVVEPPVLEQVEDQDVKSSVIYYF